MHTVSGIYSIHSRNAGTNVSFLIITCRVLHTKSLLSSPQTLCAATTNTSTRNTNTMDSQILPKAVEYLLTPLRRLSSPDQFMPAAALAQEEETGAPFKKRNERMFFFHSNNYRYTKIIFHQFNWTKLSYGDRVRGLLVWLKVCNYFPKDSRCK